MILLYALIVILEEGITEGLLKRFNKAEWLFGGFIQWCHCYSLIRSVVRCSVQF